MSLFDEAYQELRAVPVDEWPLWLDSHDVRVSRFHWWLALLERLELDLSSEINQREDRCKARWRDHDLAGGFSALSGPDRLVGGEIAQQLVAEAQLRAQYAVVAGGDSGIVRHQDVSQRGAADRARERAEATFQKPASLNPHLFHGVAP